MIASAVNRHIGMVCQPAVVVLQETAFIYNDMKICVVTALIFQQQSIHKGQELFLSFRLVGLRGQRAHRCFEG